MDHFMQFSMALFAHHSVNPIFSHYIPIKILLNPSKSMVEMGIDPILESSLAPIISQASLPRWIHVGHRQCQIRLAVGSTQLSRWSHEAATCLSDSKGTSYGLVYYVYLYIYYIDFIFDLQTWYIYIWIYMTFEKWFYIILELHDVIYYIIYIIIWILMTRNTYSLLF